MSTTIYSGLFLGAVVQVEDFFSLVETYHKCGNGHRREKPEHIFCPLCGGEYFFEYESTPNQHLITLAAELGKEVQDVWSDDLRLPNLKEGDIGFCDGAAAQNDDHKIFLFGIMLKLIDYFKAEKVEIKDVTFKELKEAEVKLHLLLEKIDVISQELELYTFLYYSYE